CRPITRRDRPAGRKMCLEGERRGQIVDGHGPGENPADRSGRVASDRVRQRHPARRIDPVEEPTRRTVAGSQRTRTGRALADDERPAFGAERTGARLVDDIRAGELVEGALDCRSQPWLDDQLLVETAPAATLRRAGDPAFIV